MAMICCRRWLVLTARIRISNTAMWWTLLTSRKTLMPPTTAIFGNWIRLRKILVWNFPLTRARWLLKIPKKSSSRLRNWQIFCGISLPRITRNSAKSLMELKTRNLCTTFVKFLKMQRAWATESVPAGTLNCRISIRTCCLVAFLFCCEKWNAALLPLTSRKATTIAKMCRA